MNIIATLAKEFSIQESQVQNTVELIDAGNTIPFIARYRKEVTGSLDDTILRNLDERLTYLRNFEKRKNEIQEAILNQEKLTDEIVAALESAVTLTELEDIYRPFRPQRKTRASVAREKGLEPLMEILMQQENTYERPLEEIACDYISEEKGVSSSEEALAGACDIIAETISDNAEYRKKIRELTYEYGTLTTTGATEEASVYSLYYDFSESLKTIPGHRILAINRGEKEGFLKVDIVVRKDLILNYLSYNTVTNCASPAAKYVSKATVDAYDRLIAPSIERELRSNLFDKAEEGAIVLFSQNLSKLLMQAPLKGKTILGYDPGYRTGCKLAVIDRSGKVLDTAVIYPTKPQEKIEESKKIVANLIRKHNIDAIAIGNGTASKESEIFIADLLREIPEKVQYTMVSEAGASVYSASKLAAEEFPDYDVTLRSAVSIARRLLDPLAELVKIDPKSIGVGQYQHDIKKTKLDTALNGVVEDCVNRVGIDLNTASHSLLSHVSGISKTVATKIVKYREENGEFSSREQILNVPGIGAHAYKQCVGFLRVPASEEPLDNTGVHPESYTAAKTLLQKYAYTEEDIKNNQLHSLREKAKANGYEALASDLNIGEPTLMDIISELEKPGRDIRDALPPPVLRSDILDMNDLKPDMILTGTVRNVVDFGAFVDIGVHQDGLVHISELSDRFIKHPKDAVSLGDVVTVRVLRVEPEKNRISLSMKNI